jgi:hypothetical protein
VGRILLRVALFMRLPHARSATVSTDPNSSRRYLRIVLAIFIVAILATIAITTAQYWSAFG